jgi:hypothetical protein
MPPCDEIFPVLKFEPLHIARMIQRAGANDERFWIGAQRHIESGGAVGVRVRVARNTLHGAAPPEYKSDKHVPARAKDDGEYGADW